MGALNDIELLTSCCSFILPQIELGETEALRALMISGSTNSINSMKAFRVHRAIIAVGMFSMFEAALQTEKGWKRPFDVLKKSLKEKKLDELASRFEQYQLAVNVLKHGDGASFRKLQNYRENLEFRIKQSDGWFEGEGDVSEGQFLIDADDTFVLTCADMINEINFVLDELG